MHQTIYFEIPDDTPAWRINSFRWLLKLYAKLSGYTFHEEYGP